MSGNNINSDLERLDAMGDEDIDDSEIPELDADFFSKAQIITHGRFAERLQQAPSEIEGR